MSSPADARSRAIIIANPRGFCAGVERAIAIVEIALQRFGAPVYVRNDVVHNKAVVEDLGARGAVFVGNLDEVPGDGLVVFSAHGVSRQVVAEARSRSLRVFDATCPLVAKVHLEVARHSRAGDECVLIGHSGHPEVEGTLGQYDGAGIYLVENEADAQNLQVNNPQRLGYVTQTTLSVDDTARIIACLRRRFPQIRGPRKDDICYATQNRQDAVKQLALESDLVLVAGSAHSSNSNRLCELARRCGAAAWLVDGPDDVDPAWLQGRQRIGLTAGASAPESVLQSIVECLRGHGWPPPTEMSGNPENVHFALPPELRGQPAQA